MRLASPCPLTAPQLHTAHTPCNRPAACPSTQSVAALFTFCHQRGFYLLLINQWALGFAYRRMIWSQARLKRSSRSSKPHRNRKQSYAAAAAVMDRLRAAREAAAAAARAGKAGGTPVGAQGGAATATGNGNGAATTRNAVVRDARCCDCLPIMRRDGRTVDRKLGDEGSGGVATSKPLPQEQQTPRAAAGLWVGHTDGGAVLQVNALYDCAAAPGAAAPMAGAGTAAAASALASPAHGIHSTVAAVTTEPVAASGFAPQGGLEGKAAPVGPADAAAALPDGGAVPFGTATVAVAVAEGVEEPEPEAASVACAAAAVADGSGAVHTADASGDEPPATQERLTSGWRPRAAAAANGASAPQRPAGASQAMRPAPTLRPANLPALSIPCDPASAGPGPAVIHMGLATPPATATGTTARGTTRLTTKVYGAYGAFTSGGTGGNWKHSAAATSTAAAAGPHGQQQQQQQQQHYQHPPGSTNTSTYPNGPAAVGHQHQAPLPPPHPAPPPPPLQLLPSASSQRLVGTPNSIAMPTPQWRDTPRPRWARLFGFATSAGGGGGGQGGHMSHLMHLDQATSLRQQLFVVMTVGVFILYTSWAQVRFLRVCVCASLCVCVCASVCACVWMRPYMWLRLRLRL